MKKYHCWLLPLCLFLVTISSQIVDCKVKLSSIFPYFFIKVILWDPALSRPTTSSTDCRPTEVFNSSSCDSTCTAVIVSKCLRPHKGCFCKCGFVRNPKSSRCDPISKCPGTTTPITETTTHPCTFSACRYQCILLSIVGECDATAENCECRTCNNNEECSVGCRQIGKTGICRGVESCACS